MRASLRLGGRWLWTLFLLSGAAMIVGCGDPGGIGKTYPVSGKVTLDGQPLTGGAIQYIPDEAAGNTSKLIPMGTIGADGAYTLTTGSATATVTGAPLGKYKVTVSTAGAMSGINGPNAPKPPAIDQKFADVTNTPLSKEVVAAPAAGAYDLTVTK